MNRLFGSLDIAIGGIFLLLGLIAIGSAPAAWQNFTREPEDFYGALSLFVGCTIIGSIGVLIGAALIRGSTVWKVSPKIASMLSAFVTASLVVVASLGFWPSDAASMELRLLLIPAVCFAVSIFLLMR